MKSLFFKHKCSYRSRNCILFYFRRFAKAETFGFGLMDIGVGSFVFAAGLVALEARKGQEFVAKNRVAYLFNSVRGSVPMLMLGFLRYFSLKGSGYHTHESEYGLHWNFFFTMAVTKVRALQEIA